MNLQKFIHVVLAFLVIITIFLACTTTQKTTSGLTKPNLQLQNKIIPIIDSIGLCNFSPLPELNLSTEFDINNIAFMLMLAKVNGYELAMVSFDELHESPAFSKYPTDSLYKYCNWFVHEIGFGSVQGLNVANKKIGYLTIQKTGLDEVMPMKIENQRLIRRVTKDEIVTGCLMIELGQQHLSLKTKNKEYEIKFNEARPKLYSYFSYNCFRSGDRTVALRIPGNLIKFSGSGTISLKEGGIVVSTHTF